MRAWCPRCDAVRPGQTTCPTCGTPLATLEDSTPADQQVGLPPPPEPPAPPPPPAPAPATPDLGAGQQRMLDLVNSARADAGVPPLAPMDELITGSQTWSEAMAAANSISHDDIGRWFGELSGCNGAGENVAVVGGPDDPVEAMFRGWMNSPGHRENILRASFTHFGFGFAEGSGGATYGTQRFASC